MNWKRVVFWGGVGDALVIVWLILVAFVVVGSQVWVPDPEVSECVCGEYALSGVCDVYVGVVTRRLLRLHTNLSVEQLRSIEGVVWVQEDGKLLGRDLRYFWHDIVDDICALEKGYEKTG